jgi:acetylornithine/N-succinyldiaminopimelate aminotransferase
MPHLMNTYGRLPVAFTHGQGCRMFDEQGKSYLDALAGIAVNTLGHNHPSFGAGVERAGRPPHACVQPLSHPRGRSGFRSPGAALSGMDEVFFCNSGCEANEAAIKLARMYGHQKGIDNPPSSSWNRPSMAAPWPRCRPPATARCRPASSRWSPVSCGCPSTTSPPSSRSPRAIRTSSRCCSSPSRARAASTLRTRNSCGPAQICDRKNWLFMVDEVQCGIGRTGAWFAHQHAGIVPDVMTLAKGLGSGVPIGACLAAGRGRRRVQAGQPWFHLRRQPAGLRCRA